MTQNRRFYFEMLTSWVTKTCVETSSKHLMVVRMYDFAKIHNVATQDLVNFLIIQSARGSLMLITFSQNTLHYREETARGGGGAEGRSGVLAPHPCLSGP